MEKKFIIVSKETDKIITASIVIATLKNDPHQFVMIHNKRGWDLPGGHTKKKEKPLKTIQREFSEETGGTLLSAYPIGILTNISLLNTGIMVYRGICALNRDKKSYLEIKVVTKEELLNSYYGDKKLLLSLLQISI